MEAAALRCFLNDFLPQIYEENEDIASIVLCDFNDTPASVPLEVIRGTFDQDPGPSSPWTEVDKRALITCARLHLKKGAHEDKL